jgi:dihydrolipoamide dehydrogenase
LAGIECDVAIIGAGTAGIAAERAARRVGSKTLLIDDRFAGTTCATVGCMPSKLLIAAANSAHNARKASIFGIKITEPIIDGRAVMNRLREQRDAFVAATLRSISEIPAGICVRQRASFTDPHTLALDDERHVSAKAFVIATGARPAVPEIFDGFGKMLLTNETIFELTTLPQSIAVVGAGPLGLELAQALARLGVETEVFEQSSDLAAVSDPDIADALRSTLAAELPMHFGVKLQAARDEEFIRISWSGASSGARSFERVLVATGRPPELKDLNLAATGVLTDTRGIPVFDTSTLQCGDSSIFLAGDVDGQRPVLHEAAFEGAIAGRNAAAFPDIQERKRAVPFSIVFTDPPLAVIGEQQSERRIIGSASYADQGRAKVDACNAGLVRVYADRESGVLTGAVLYGPAMDHVSHLVVWAIERGETASKMLALPFYHPTFEEGLKPALREICEKVNAPELGHIDTIGPPGA